MRLRLLPFALLLLFLILPVMVGAQLGTQHGVMVTWQASTSTVAGYNVYRSLPSAAPAKVNSILVPGLSYLDGSVTTSTTYQYFATAVDANGNESVASNLSTVSVGASLPTNPAPPSGCNTKVQ